MLNPYQAAVVWNLKDRVKHGDVQSSREAQQHLDAIVALEELVDRMADDLLLDADPPVST